jgi:two-component system sensor histidine kinase KdpD
VLAGVIASIAYNLLFSYPYLRFSVASADDLVPIIALNVSAIGSGLIAGRLRDRAVAAETSSRRIGELLKFSQDLQRALSFEQIQHVVGEFLNINASKIRVSFATAGAPSMPLEPAANVTGAEAVAEEKRTLFLLKSGDGAVGQLAIDHDGGVVEELVEPLLPIVAMATERCILASEAAEADLLRRSERFKTALLSSVSHDLRTPLSRYFCVCGQPRKPRDTIGRGDPARSPPNNSRAMQ